MTRLVRVGKTNYERLHQLAGKIQAKTGKKTSIDEAINFLFSHKSLDGTDEKASKKAGKPAQTGDSLRLFSLKHKKYIE